MADVMTNSPKRSTRGYAHAKKLSTRVDLTPMVDLGFLLITFFIFTTTMSESTVLSLILPDDTKIAQPQKYRESTVLTVLPSADDKIFYYHGTIEDAIKSGNYGVTTYSLTEGVGKIIREKKRRLALTPGFKSGDMVLIIRPAADARFKNIVDALDEVLINDVTHYSFTDISDDELNLIKKIRN